VWRTKCLGWGAHNLVSLCLSVSLFLSLFFNSVMTTFLSFLLKGFVLGQAPVTHTCNPSCLEGWDQEDHGLKPASANSLQDPISKITRAKWTGGVAQVVQCLLCKCEALSSNSHPIKNRWFVYHLFLPVPRWKVKHNRSYHCREWTPRRKGTNGRRRKKGEELSENETLFSPRNLIILHVAKP
jgi:hypothetical protein